MLRPLVRYWRARGHMILMYLDDYLSAAAGGQKALEASQLVRTTPATACCSVSRCSCVSGTVVVISQAAYPGFPNLWHLSALLFFVPALVEASLLALRCSFPEFLRLSSVS